MAAHGGADLSAKHPHWGDAILCDGLLYAAHALDSDAPTARAWFSPKLADGPRTDGSIWFWSSRSPSRPGSLHPHRRTGLSRLRTRGGLGAGVQGYSHARRRNRASAIEAVWIDISYFSAPAMARLGLLRNDAALIERALDQLYLHQRGSAGPGQRAVLARRLRRAARPLCVPFNGLGDGSSLPDRGARGDGRSGTRRTQGTIRAEDRANEQALARQLNTIVGLPVVAAFGIR